MAYTVLNTPILIGTDLFAASNLDNVVVDAAGESLFTIGQVWLEDGPSSSSKTISSSGGGIYYFSFSTTFSNAGTTLRFGIQGVNATTGLNDDTFVVYGDLVGGTDTISFNQHKLINISSGSLSISHGDIIAIGVDMVSRGGTDSLTVATLTRNYGPSPVLLPYSVINTTTKTSAYANFGIVFDDGSVGWINTVGHVRASINSDSYNTSSSHDEHGLVFQLPFKCKISGFNFFDNFNASPDATYKLYSDPTGTPVEIASVTFDGNYLRATGSTVGATYLFDTEYELLANTDYCLSRLATSTDSVNWSYSSFSDAGFKKQKMLPTSALYRRDGGTGAFTFLRDELYLNLQLRISAVDSGGEGGVPYII